MGERAIHRMTNLLMSGSTMALGLRYIWIGVTVLVWQWVLVMLDWDTILVPSLLGPLSGSHYLHQLQCAVRSAPVELCIKNVVEYGFHLMATAGSPHAAALWLIRRCRALALASGAVGARRLHGCHQILRRDAEGGMNFCYVRSPSLRKIMVERLCRMIHCLLEVLILYNVEVVLIIAAHSALKK